MHPFQKILYHKTVFQGVIYLITLILTYFLLSLPANQYWFLVALVGFIMVINLLVMKQLKSRIENKKKIKFSGFNFAVGMNYLLFFAILMYLQDLNRLGEEMFFVTGGLLIMGMVFFRQMEYKYLKKGQ